MTVACAPERGRGSSVGLGGLLSAAPPGTSPGQALALTNHSVGRAEHALQAPPSSAAGLPAWLLPAALVLSASDAASSARQPMTSLACSLFALQLRSSEAEGPQDACTFVFPFLGCMHAQ